MSVNTDAAYVELADAKKAAKESRKAFRQTPVVSAFVRAMQKAMGLYRQAILDGMSRDLAREGLEAELRAAWPKSVSKFAPKCQTCDDTGYEEQTCWERHRCGREVCARNPERVHAYVVPCHCPAGDAKRKRQWKPDDALTAAGKMPKKRGWRQVGA